MRAARDEVGWFEHNRVSVGEHRGDLPGGDCDWKIPGYDIQLLAQMAMSRLDIDDLVSCGIDRWRLVPILLISSPELTDARMT
jgi:hypothetical protein